MEIEAADHPTEKAVEGIDQPSRLEPHRFAQWQSRGRIINTSTTVTRTICPAYGFYAATKAAVEAMTLVLARELRGRLIL